MPTMKIGAGLAAQLKAGASILAAAATVDTRAITTSLGKFSRAHEQFRSAQEHVDLLATQLANTRRELRKLDAEQDAAVERLAAMLALNGWPRRKPFAAFGAPAPSVLVRLPFAEEARRIHRLVATVMLIKGLRRETRQAARRADLAATAVERSLRLASRQASVLRVARHQRNTMARHCTTAVSTLKLRVRAATAANDEGTHGLYAALFERPTRKVAKRSKRPRAAVPSRHRTRQRGRVK